MISKEAVGNSWDILNAILSHIYSDQSNGFISNEWIQNLQQKWVLLQSVKGEFSVHDQLFCRHQHRGSLHSVTRKLDLDQTSMAHKHTKRHKCDKTHFSVRPRDFLHQSPIHSALYAVIMFVLLCLCRFIWQIILFTYMSYELVAHFDSILRSISGWFLNFKSLFSNSLPSQNLNMNKFSEYCIN